MEKIQSRCFQIKIVTTRVYANWQLTWRPTVGRSWQPHHFSNDLKKLWDVVQSTNERSSKFKKYPLYSSLSKKFRKTTSFSTSYGRFPLNSRKLNRRPMLVPYWNRFYFHTKKSRFVCPNTQNGVKGPEK